MATPRFPIDEAPHPMLARKTMEDALTVMHGGPPPFQWIEEDGRSLIGCYAPLCYSPVMARQFFSMAKAGYEPAILKPRNRELAILGLCSILDAPYIVYCHRAVGARDGLTENQYDEGLAGRTPQGLSEEEETAYSLGRKLTALTGPLDEVTWQEASSKMAKSEIVGIVNIIAGYR
ncbi:Uu.00g058920.m01.CDS01 [Anthostomella pinea]|uniref:Uu.00g058920.m01.CDS01 n=1 Tax=Anthostomella pinea TaxID=933095 RepID=A0AAI8YMA0_9PEZI|nr:Uu.00g058920.m01.CDS01 [Anthostomella pinea]